MSVAAGERRIVSVLVADIAGSTAIGERLGPERSKFLFDDVVRLMRQEVERLGGTVAQLTGDGIFALFGTPTAHEDDAERAVRAALAIHDALGRYDAEMGPAYGIALQARVAVNTGPVAVPTSDEPPEILYNALGDTVNVAARLESTAGEGGVCIGERTARQLEGLFELEPLGGLQLKGKRDRVHAFVVSGIREPESVPVAPIVGRAEEVTALENTLDALLEGRGAVLSITGEPGIGKSRLVLEAKERYGDRVRFLEGHATSYAEEIPYWPVRELLRDWLGLGVSDPEARVRLELQSALARELGDDADEAYPLLATLLGLALEGEPAERIRDLSRDSVRRQTTDWLSRLVGALARERPVCLVFEDLHSADESTLAILENLLDATEDEAVGFVLVHRSDPEHAAWHVVDRARRHYRHRFRELELAPLQREASYQLAAQEAGAEVPDAVAELLAERSGGNPFFLAEALRDLVERGLLRRANGRVELTADVDEFTVPAVVQETLQARLDRLGLETRDVLSVAAVIGRSFGQPLLEQLIPRAQLRPALAELQRLDLVLEERRQPAREYRFRHGLVQEAAYEALTDARRRELHLSVGEGLEELHRESPDEVYGLLARHFAAADEAERAADYLLKAGDAARIVYADEEALEHYRRALEFLDRLGDAERARATLFKVALTHHLAFDFSSANAAYGAASRLPGLDPGTSRLDQTLRLAAARLSPELLVPGTAYDTEAAWLAQSLYRGLVSLDRNLNVIPAVAERMEVADDGRVYRFALDPRACWSDGVAVGAGDFVSSLERMREEGAATAYLLAEVEAAREVGERELEIRLSRPQSYLPYLLALWWYPRPRHRDDSPEAGKAARDGTVTNGPFVLAEVRKDSARFEANPHWHGRRGNVGTVEFVVLGVGDPESFARVWLEGLVDIGFSDERRAVEAPETIAEFWPSFDVGFLQFRERPPFDDDLVRRAFAHAVDRERLRERVRASRDLVGGDVMIARAGGLIPPTMPGHGHRAGLPYDLAKARALLARAGYPSGRGLPRIEVTVGWKPFGEAIAEQYAELGVDTEIVLDPETMLAIGRGDPHVQQRGWSADYPDPEGVLGGLNTVTFRDPAAGAMLAEAAELTDRNARLRLYQAIDAHLVSERVCAVPTGYGRSITLRRPWIEGLWENPLIPAPFDELVVRPELRP